MKAHQLVSEWLLNSLPWIGSVDIGLDKCPTELRALEFFSLVGESGNFWPHHLQENSFERNWIRPWFSIRPGFLWTTRDVQDIHIDYRIRPSLIFFGYYEISASIFSGTILHNYFKMTIFESLTSDWTDTLSDAPKNWGCDSWKKNLWQQQSWKDNLFLE